jgi:hypothetical protein
MITTTGERTGAPKHKHLPPADYRDRAKETFAATYDRRGLESAYFLAANGFEDKVASKFRNAVDVLSRLHVYEVMNNITWSDVDRTTEQAVKYVMADIPPPEHRRFARFIQCKDYRGTACIQGVDCTERGTELSQGGEMHNAFPVRQREQVYLYPKRQGLISPVSMEIRHNEPDWVASFTRSTVQAMYVSEAMACYFVLEGAGFAPDGDPFYIDMYNSIDTVKPFNLADMLALFRTQTFRDTEPNRLTNRLVNASPKFLLVNTANEIEARKQRFDNRLEGVIDIIVRPGLKNAYLLADPMARPTICRGALENDPVRLDFGWDKDSHQGKGIIGARVQSEFDFALSSRYGIVRQVL